MAYDKEKRYSIETISIYYKNANDMVIIGCFNDPHGPRRECGQPYVIRESGFIIGHTRYTFYSLQFCVVIRSFNNRLVRI